MPGKWSDTEAAVRRIDALYNVPGREMMVDYDDEIEGSREHQGVTETDFMGLPTSPSVDIYD